MKIVRTPFHAKTLAFILLSAVAASGSATTLIGPSPYLCFDGAAIAGCGTSDSPFVGLSFSEFYLEDFEDGALNTPSVTGDGFIFSGASNVDSVDEDDGTIDGTGAFRQSYARSIIPGVNPELIFEFSTLPLSGQLPTHVGIVWTDGLPADITVTFEAFDDVGVSLGTIVAAGFPDNSRFGETAEDSFFGVMDLGGISKISVKNSNTQTFGLEVDHLQYGFLGSVPEPTTLLLLGLGLAGLGFAKRRLH